jgi:hypothetical protein
MKQTQIFAAGARLGVVGMVAGTLVAGTLAGSAAFAQDGGTTTGGFELEFARIEGSSSLILDGDIDLRYRGSGFGGAGLGFDLGVDATFDLSEGEQDTALYAAAVGNWGFGDIAIGMPRGIGDVLIDRPSIAGMQMLDDLSRVFFPPVTGVLAKYSSKPSFGIRYENSMNDLRYGASALKVRDIEGVFIEAAGEYAIGQGAVEGMIEYNTELGKANALVGFQQAAGQLEFGAYLSRQNIGIEGTSIQGSVDYRMTENFVFGGDLVRLDSDGDKVNLVGASMEYGFGSGIYGQLGFAHANSGDSYWDASVGFKF